MTNILPHQKRNRAEDEIVVMDINPCFKVAVRQVLGQPVIVIDQLHFAQFIYMLSSFVLTR
ncbi:transposase [Lysinibacillus pakistanensis]|uniref:transposase n=1 Tax=Lysinibacillus pakistanensis TaxID=759811 RepID=UPI003D2DE347